MRNTAVVVVAGALLAGTAIPVYAGGLLGGVIGNSDALITINQGSAADSGLVNLGLGGGDGNIVDLGVGGGSQPLVGATVGTGSSQLGADVSVGSNLVDTTVDVGNGDSLLDADVGLLNNQVAAKVNVGGPSLVGVGVALLPNNPGTGGPGTPNGPGTPGGVGNPGNSGNPLNPVVPLDPLNPGNLANGDGNGMPSCDGGAANGVARLIQNTQADASWARASGVQVLRVDLCPEVELWLAAELKGSALGNALRAAVQGDALLSASLSRTSYGPDRVFAINKKGSQLIVYVY